ncbi:dihydroxyacetone kinase [Kwoniella heveanensis CBS 569]|uniref:Dihydroxyacetone kinase n=1 Tax=Kwoniella heveanensis BCC8398 TaxID=1296120 RepID=A0A1B9GKG3_9TREE|nr:dihydroxyacetone kinase [Kwoniella heveanensis BCC8398]OCF38527.1 dihydroxyacetone kinase [Kwoniella heveanensis CBS 569]
MASKHLHDDPAALPLQYLHGLAVLNPDLSVDESHKVLHKRNHDRNTVAVISGGGSGHEVDAGFVGQGMLSAAVAGNVFASPNARQIRRALTLVDNEKGTLVVVKRYTGDVLQFGLAGESVPGNVEFLVVGDDVAVGRKQGAIVGRRGLAGVTLVYKVAGYLAQQGLALDEIRRVASLVASNVGTIGSSLAHCHVPGTETEESTLQSDELEIGTGIHNEPGLLKLRPVPSASELVERMVALLTATDDPDRSFLSFKGDGKDSIVLMINNLGGISELELVALVTPILAAFARRGISVARLLTGTFMSSLDMSGFSITACLLPRDVDSDVILQALDGSTDAPGWRKSSVPLPKPTITPPAAGLAPSPPSGLSAPVPQDFIAAIRSACHRVIAAEPEITRYDVIAGDGDCGLTLTSGAEGVLKAIEDGSIDGGDITNSIKRIGAVIEDRMGGTSGALYAIFFAGLAQELSSQTGQTSPAIWSNALSAAFNKLCQYTSARPPSRTLVDPLAAFTEVLAANPHQLAEAAKSAKDAALNTAKLVASAGRAAYVDQAALQEEDVPDPGAWGLTILFEGIHASVAGSGGAQ